MRPSRIVVGEVRQEECLDLLIASNSGVPGMCSVHANSAREAVTKMCTLPLLAGENVGHAFVVPTVASSVDLVIHAETDPAGRRRVREIVALPGRVESDVIEVADLFVTAGRPAGPCRRLPAARRTLRAARLRAPRPAAAPGWTDVVGALAGLLLGLGLVLVLGAFLPPTRGVRPPDARPGRLEDARPAVGGGGRHGRHGS